MDYYSTRQAASDIWKDGMVFEVGSLFAWFSSLADSRQARGKVYELALGLTLIFFAKLSGADSLRGIAGWLGARRDLLCDAFQLTKKRMPSRQTVTRLLAEVVPAPAWEDLVSQVLQQLPGAGASARVNLDGKTLRGTITATQPQGVHLLAAYLPEEGLVLAQVEVGRKENEIPVALRVVKSLDLRGKIVTGDALLTQRKLCLQIVAQGGEYVFKVKANQPQLSDDLQRLFAPEPVVKGFSPASHDDFQTAQTEDKGHGRVEVRSITVSQMLNDYTEWPHLAQVFQLRQRTTIQHSGQVTETISYGITSLTAHEATPERLLEIARRHWGIENQLHYRRDVTLHEDAGRLRVGHGPQVMAALNNLVLGLLAWLGYDNIRQARQHFEAHFEEAFSLVQSSPW
jgi:predicted transposase YbfD/YdcC